MIANPLAADLDHILAQTAGLWEDMRGTRIFLTGGTGFFGCWLLESLLYANERLRLGASVTVLTRDREAFRRKARHLGCHPVELHVGDVCSFDPPPGRFDYAIHAAAPSSTQLNERNPLAMFDILVNGTRRTLDFAVSCGARKFLLTSSGAVYGKQPPEISHVSEDYCGGPALSAPESAYAEGKRAAELLCAIYHRTHGLETKVARCFAFAGPYLPLDAHFAIGNFIADALNGGPIRVTGDGSPFRSYLYAADLAVWLWTILMRGKPCRPYNVGSEAQLTIAEIAGRVSRVLGAAGVEIALPAQPGMPASRYVPSTARARDELGLAESVPIDEAIRRSAEWNRRACETRGPV